MSIKTVGNGEISPALNREDHDTFSGKIEYQIKEDVPTIGYKIIKKGFHHPEEYTKLRESVGGEWKSRGWNITFLKTKENNDPSIPYKYLLVLKVWKYLKPDYYCPYLVEIKHNLGLTRLCTVKGEYKEEFVGAEAPFCRTGKWKICPLRLKYSL